MTIKQTRFSPVQQEYFQRPQQKGYKECNRYRIAEITLENFGLKIINDPKNATNIQGVGSHDRMSITTPDENKEDIDNKPFCCTHCGSESYIKYGKNNGKQVYKCKVCNCKFVDNLYFEKLKAEPKIICLTLDLYFKGCSLRKISDHLKQFYELEIAHTTLFNWIGKYIKIMDKYVSQFKPKLGTVWQVDEMMVQVDGDWFYLWNIMDEFTRFHLASVISKERNVEKARKVFQVAKKRSQGDRPLSIVSDGLGSYKKAINKEFHTKKHETVHIGNTGIRGKYYKNAKFFNNGVERLHGTIRERNKTQRGLEKEDSVFFKGHQLYYNFIRPHDSLNGYTPAHFANLYLNLGNKKWENLLMQAIENKNNKN